MKNIIIISLFIFIILMMIDPGGSPSNEDRDDDPN
jgi:hypothetical protein